MLIIYYKEGHLNYRKTMLSVMKYYATEYIAGRKPIKPVINSGVVDNYNEL